MSDAQRWGLLVVLVVVVVSLQIAIMPTWFRCMNHDATWLKPWGRVHCDLEAWRSLGR